MPASRYGEATGITQTVRNFGSSLGLAVLGTILILENKVEPGVDASAPGASPRRRPTRSPTASARAATASCASVAHSAGAGAAKLFATVPHDFALASRTVFYGMAAVMAVAFVVALVAMPGGKVEEQVEEEPGEAGPLAGPA